MLITLRGIVYNMDIHDSFEMDNIIIPNETIDVMDYRPPNQKIIGSAILSKSDKQIFATILIDDMHKVSFNIPCISGYYSNDTKIMRIKNLFLAGVNDDHKIKPLSEWEVI